MPAKRYFWAMLEEFLGALRMEGVSSHTLEAYERDLRGWGDFCRAQYGWSPLESVERWLSVTPRMVRAWLRTFGRAVTRARKVAALRRMDRYVARCSSRAGWTFSPGAVKVAPSLPKALPKQQLLALYAQMDEKLAGWPGIRDRLVLELLYGLGLRRGEVVSLRVEQVHFELGQVHILGKGQRWRVMPLYPWLEALLRSYLGARAALRPQHPYLLCTDKGSPIYPRLVHRIVRRWLGTHPHALRHSFATHLLDEGAHVEGVRALLGHSSLATTQKYLAITPSQLKEAYLRFHPRA